MNILVTGATGFIGSHVIEYLLSQGKSVIATAASSRETAEAKYSFLKDTDYISKNLNDKEENYYAFFKYPDCVIHLSWEGLPNYNELFHIERNLPANFYFIKNMLQNGLSDISIAGTCFEYGLRCGMLDEEMTAEPVTVYGLAKDTLRKFVVMLHNKYDFTMKWIRLFYLYGHGQGKKSLWTQLEDAVENNCECFNMSLGEQLRDYISVHCAAEFISKIAIQKNITGVINCCSGKPVSVRNFVEGFLKDRNQTMKLNRGFYPYSEYEPLAFWGDTAKLQKIIKGESHL